MIDFSSIFLNKKLYQDPVIQAKISYRLSNLFEPTSRMDKVVCAVIKEVMDRKIVPYFTDVITRHSEREFHYKIANGFDLVDDMRINHPNIYHGFVGVARKLNKRLRFNEGVLLEMIVNIVQEYPYKWTITESERTKLFEMILRLKDEIYS
jgi:hypothetical protein